MSVPDKLRGFKTKPTPKWLLERGLPVRSHRRDF